MSDRDDVTTCRCGSAMVFDQRWFSWRCPAWPSAAPSDDHSEPVTERYLIANNLSSTRGAAVKPAPFNLPGYRWTGEFFERLGPPPHREIPAQWKDRPAIGRVPWLRIAFWTVLALAAARLL